MDTKSIVNSEQGNTLRVPKEKVRSKNFTILVVEDNDDDLTLLLRAWRKLGVEEQIRVARSGQEAIAYLKGDGKFADRKLYQYPSFITTDLKMACGDGMSVLEHLHTNPEWAVIPTSVLSSSSDLDDIRMSYRLGASSYHIKPHVFADLEKLLTTLHQYWLLCEVPQVDETGKHLATRRVGKMGERFDQ